MQPWTTHFSFMVIFHPLPLEIQWSLLKHDTELKQMPACRSSTWILSERVSICQEGHSDYVAGRHQQNSGPAGHLPYQQDEGSRINGHLQNILGLLWDITSGCSEFVRLNYLKKVSIYQILKKMLESVAGRTCQICCFYPTVTIYRDECFQQLQLSLVSSKRSDDACTKVEWMNNVFVKFNISAYLSAFNTFKRICASHWTTQRKKCTKLLGSTDKVGSIS